MTSFECVAQSRDEKIEFEIKSGEVHKNLRKKDLNAPELVEVSRTIDWLPTGWAHSKPDVECFILDDLKVDDCKE